MEAAQPSGPKTLAERFRLLSDLIAVPQEVAITKQREYEAQFAAESNAVSAFTGGYFVANPEKVQQIPLERFTIPEGTLVGFSIDPESEDFGTLLQPKNMRFAPIKTTKVAQVLGVQLMFAQVILENGFQCVVPLTLVPLPPENRGFFEVEADMRAKMGLPPERGVHISSRGNKY